MSGFRNPIATQQGALIKEQVKSPNYVPGGPGWSINKDGTAEFTDIVVSDAFEPWTGPITLAQLLAAYYKNIQGATTSQLGSTYTTTAAYNTVLDLDINSPIEGPLFADNVQLYYDVEFFGDIIVDGSAAGTCQVAIRWQIDGGAFTTDGKVLNYAPELVGERAMQSIKWTNLGPVAPLTDTALYFQIRAQHTGATTYRILLANTYFVMTPKVFFI